MAASPEVHSVVKEIQEAFLRRLESEASVPPALATRLRELTENGGLRKSSDVAAAIRVAVQQ